MAADDASLSTHDLVTHISQRNQFSNLRPKAQAYIYPTMTSILRQELYLNSIVFQIAACGNYVPQFLM
jgi:hypothetical protein